MRIVFIGAGSLSVATARLLLRRRHEVVIIEREKERIDALTGDLDCGFLHGDGSRPAVLREVDPASCDFLFCLTGADQANILASLVGRSLGFKRVVTKIEDAELGHVCLELGLRDTIIPTHTIGGYLAEMVAGHDPLEISGMIKGEARMFSFVAEEDTSSEKLELPTGARLVCLYRKGDLVLPRGDTGIKKGDEVVLLVEHKVLEKVAERWGKPAAGA